LPGSSSVSVCLQAVPARSPPVYGFFLVRSYHGGTSPKKHINLQPIMLLSRCDAVLQEVEGFQKYEWDCFEK
jgi:hypothetical protein